MWIQDNGTLTEEDGYYVEFTVLDDGKTLTLARGVSASDIIGFRFHDFRHTAVTKMRRAGIDHLTIMRITGHKTMEVFKRYNSFFEGDLRDAAARFNTYLTLAHQPQIGQTANTANSQ